MARTAPPERSIAADDAPAAARTRPTDARPTRPRATARRRAAGAAVALLLVVWAGLLILLGAQERGGPPHIDLSLGDGIPATLYVPGEGGDDFPVQPPPGERPPVVVIAHGYSADRLIMSSLARSLATAGYAALTFDFRGHGSNTGEFHGELRQDLEAVVDWVTTSPNVDGERIAVLGHSMGAGAALDFATLDPRVGAVIPVSGGYGVNDAEAPPSLFLVAEGDPGRIHDRQRDLASILRDRTDVRSVEIGGTDHLTILWSGDTVREVVDFLDPVFGVSRAGGDEPGLDDPRLGTSAAYVLVFLALVALLGLAVGRAVPPLPLGGSAWGLVLVLAALVVTMPLMVTGGPGFLPLGAGQPVVVHVALAGALLWAARAAVGRGMVTGRPARWLAAGPWLPVRHVAVPGLAAGLVMVVLLVPVGVVFHRLVPTAERAVLWAVVGLLALPFFAAFEAVVRRGSTWRAIGLGVLGRIVLLVVLVIGVWVEVLPQVLALVVPLLVLQYVVLEVFAATCYGRGRNPAVIAVVDSVFIGWIVVTLTPVG